MIAWLTRLFFFATLALIPLAAHLLHVDWLRAALLIVVVAASTKLLLTLVSFALAAYANRDDPIGFRVSPMRMAYGIVSEWAATLRTLYWSLPWEVLRRVRAPNPRRTGSLPVLFIHGYVCNRGVWIAAANRAAARGFLCESMTLEPAFGSIDAYPSVVARAVDELCARAHSDRVVIVAHSMGGLATRAYLRTYGAQKIAHVITVGTPHHSTALARFGPGQNSAQMRAKSPWLAAIGDFERTHALANFTTFFSRIDNIVAPARSAALTDAKAVEFDDVGHVALMFAPRAVNVLLDEIERVARQ